MKDIEQEISAVFDPLKELPYLFIGSGMSMRYYNLPTWENLLRALVRRVQPDNPLAYEAYRASVQVERAMGPAPMPAIASKIEADFIALWSSNAQFARELEPFSSLLRAGVSPFKIAVANYVAENSRRSSDQKIADEFSCLKLLGKRSIAGVITTNYDQMAEDLFGGFQVFVGQETLLFSSTQGIAEIYKIHGCCQHPSSIIINQSDYDTFDERKAYLAAKLLTIFVEHPIVFLGYSISDPNIESILKAITGCLSPENLSKLQKRLIFIEYSPDPDVRPEVRGHSLSFEAGRTVEMTKIVLNDYMPLYRVLSNKKYAYNPKLLRQLKRDIYQLVATNQPSSAFRVADIEDDAALDHLDVVVGVGVGNGAGQASIRSHHIPDISELFRDILFDDGVFDIQSLVESALPPLLKSHSGSLPIHKYVSRYREQFQRDPPLAVLECCRSKYDEFLNKTIIRNRARCAPDRQKSIEAILAATPDDRHRIDAIKILSETEIDASKLRGFLTDSWNRDPAIFTAQGVSSDFRRLVKIFDWLTYGKKEGPSSDGPSKTVHAPTT
ncbi:MAG: hypothetical protein BWY57_02299 [Betaproteobacteria bacterium ADurb.Bin341]|nr:MAG: hypothetical protein BWY57_02299 [Betaproteobacteria bacterium ADurb.Bin341]